jgi:hypothetical protein
MARRRPSARGVGNAVLIALVLGVIVTQGFGASANHRPADKVSVAGSEMQRLGPAAGATTILSETIKLSTPSDLILGLTLECSIITDLFNTGDSTQSVEALIKTWVTIDGKVVPVSTDDTTEPGEVVFCNRAHRQEIDENDSDDGDDDIEQFQATRHANAFNWMALDDGNYDDPAIPAGSTNNIILVEVHAELETTAACASFAPDNQNCATGFVGHRTLVIEPVKSANDEAITELTA